MLIVVITRPPASALLFTTAGETLSLDGFFNHNRHLAHILFPQHRLPIAIVLRETDRRAREPRGESHERCPDRWLANSQPH